MMSALHESLAILVFIRSALAAPQPQAIVLEEIEDNPTANIRQSVLSERSCKTLPRSCGPGTDPDTFEGFFLLQESKNVPVNATILG